MKKRGWPRPEVNTDSAAIHMSNRSLANCGFPHHIYSSNLSFPLGSQASPDFCHPVPLFQVFFVLSIIHTSTKQTPANTSSTLCWRIQSDSPLPVKSLPIPQLSTAFRSKTPHSPLILFFIAPFHFTTEFLQSSQEFQALANFLYFFFIFSFLSYFLSKLHSPFKFYLSQRKLLVTSPNTDHSVSCITESGVLVNTLSTLLV